MFAKSDGVDQTISADESIVCYIPKPHAQTQDP